ncbi:MAG: ECF-type sigma factor [Candidatus Thorarchaeota archaeon]
MRAWGVRIGDWAVAAEGRGPFDCAGGGGGAVAAGGGADLIRCYQQRIASDTLEQRGPAVGDELQNWDGRGHFFKVAAAMRRTLIDNARRQKRRRRGDQRRVRCGGGIWVDGCVRKG